MTLVVQLIHQLVVGVFVADEVCGCSRTLVVVFAIIEELAVGFNVNDIDGIVESEEHELK